VKVRAAFGGSWPIYNWSFAEDHAIQVWLQK
jgi:hypothetical protein